MTDLHVLYRLAPTRKSEVRPHWFSQIACIRSFERSVQAARDQQIDIRTSAIVDGQIDDAVRSELDQFDEVIDINLLGNSRAFRFTLDFACTQQYRFILFAEDDYMWHETAVTDTLAALVSVPRAGYASPYAHPIADNSTKLQIREVWRHRRRNFEVAGTTWRTTTRTTMTFACPTDQLRRDRHYWWLASYGAAPSDSYAFAAILDGRWLKLVGNAAFRRFRRVTNWATVRLVIECTSRRLLASRRIVLIQPLAGLATHVHMPYITGPHDWQELAASVGE